MNISLQNVDNVSAVLTVQIEKADYQEKVEKALKTLRQRVNMPGFRKGMVPMGLIKKQYGTSVLLEEVDKLLQEKVGEYIRENKVNMLGTPLPKENNANFETDENFEFSFDIALAPEFNVELSNNDTVDYYDINVTDEMVDQQVNMYRQRTAKYDKVEDYQDKDMLKGLLAELDENGNTKEGGAGDEGRGGEVLDLRIGEVDDGGEGLAAQVPADGGGHPGGQEAHRDGHGHHQQGQGQHLAAYLI